MPATLSLATVALGCKTHHALFNMHLCNFTDQLKNSKCILLSFKLFLCNLVDLCYTAKVSKYIQYSLKSDARIKWEEDWLF